jgi:hypothetical protein
MSGKIHSRKITDTAELISDEFKTIAHTHMATATALFRHVCCTAASLTAAFLSFEPVNNQEHIGTVWDKRIDVTPEHMRE